MKKTLLTIILSILSHDLYATIESFSNTVHVLVDATGNPYRYDVINTTLLNPVYSPFATQTDSASGLSANASALFRASNITSEIFVEGSVDYSGYSTLGANYSALGTAVVLGYYYIRVLSALERVWRAILLTVNEKSIHKKSAHFRRGVSEGIEVFLFGYRSADGSSDAKRQSSVHSADLYAVEAAGGGNGR